MTAKIFLRIVLPTFWLGFLTVFLGQRIEANSYYSDYGSSKNHSVTISSSGSIYFEVHEIANNKRTEWYVDNNHKETDDSSCSWWLCNPPDPDYTVSFDVSSKFSWEVKALVYDGSSLEEYHKWNVSYQAPAPSAPSGLSATNVTHNSATVSWSSVSGATYYQYRYRRDDQHSWPSWTNNGNSNSVNLSSLTSDMGYEFQVRACNASGCSSATGSTWLDLFKTKEAPDRTDPENPDSWDFNGHSANQWSNDKSLDFEWSGASDNKDLKGCYYRWSTSSSTSVSSSYSGYDSGPSGSATKTVSDGSWYFHIRCYDEAGNSDLTDHYGPFKIDTTKPTVALTSPADGHRTKDRRPTFKWSGSDNGSGIRDYQIDVDDTGGATRYYDGVSSGWKVTRDLAIGDVDWRVKACDNANNCRLTQEWDLDIIEKTTTNFGEVEEVDTLIKGVQGQLRAELNYVHASGYSLDLNGKTVKFYRDSVSSSNLLDSVTSAKGQATIDFTPNSSGNFSLIAVFEGDDDYKPTRKSAIINVKGRPDLELKNLAISPSSPTVVDEVTYWVDVENAGDGNFDPSFWTFNDNFTVSFHKGSTELCSKANNGNLNVGVTESFSCSSSDVNTVGDHPIKAKIVYGSNVPAHQKDNQGAKEATFTWRPKPKSNLSVALTLYQDALEFKGTGTDTIAEAKVKVTNSGEARSSSVKTAIDVKKSDSASYVRSALSDGDGWDDNDDYLVHGTIAAGDHDEEPNNSHVNINTALSVGTHKIKACITHFDAEKDQVDPDNKCAEKEIKVSAKQVQMRFGNVGTGVEPSNPTKGQNFTIKANLEKVSGIWCAWGCNIAGKTLVFYVDGVEKGQVSTDENGDASLAVFLPVSQKRSVEVKVEFAGQTDLQKGVKYQSVAWSKTVELNNLPPNKPGNLKMTPSLQASTLTFTWDEVTDRDGDQITYRFEYECGIFSHVFSCSKHRLPVSNAITLNASEFTGGETVKWRVVAVDSGFEKTESERASFTAPDFRAGFKALEPVRPDGSNWVKASLLNPPVLRFLETNYALKTSFKAKTGGTYYVLLEWKKASDPDSEFKAYHPYDGTASSVIDLAADEAKDKGLEFYPPPEGAPSPFTAAGDYEARVSLLRSASEADKVAASIDGTWAGKRSATVRFAKSVVGQGALALENCPTHSSFGKDIGCKASLQVGGASTEGWKLNYSLLNGAGDVLVASQTASLDKQGKASIGMTIPDNLPVEKFDGSYIRLEFPGNEYLESKTKKANIQITQDGVTLGLDELQVVSNKANEIEYGFRVSNANANELDYHIGVTVLKDGKTLFDLGEGGFKRIAADSTRDLSFTASVPGLADGQYRLVVALWNAVPSSSAIRYDSETVTFTLQGSPFPVEAYPDAVVFPVGSEAAKSTYQHDNDEADWTLANELTDLQSDDDFLEEPSWENFSYQSNRSRLDSHMLYAEGNYRFDLSSDLSSDFKRLKNSPGLNGKTPLILIHGWQGDNGLNNYLGFNRKHTLPDQYWQEFIHFSKPHRVRKPWP